MDPKQPTTLDPKLQEAYDRVMNSTPAQASQPTTQSMPASSPAMPQQPQMTQTPAVTPQAPVPPPVMTPTNATPTPSTTQQPQPVMTSMQSTAAIPNTNPPMNTPMPMLQKSQAGSSVHGFVSSQTKKSSTTPSFLYVLAAFVFFVVYTIFWLKFFKVSLPLPFLQ
jgi:hypothetical protein